MYGIVPLFHYFDFLHGIVGYNRRGLREYDRLNVVPVQEQDLLVRGQQVYVVRRAQKIVHLLVYDRC